ncbi:MAG: cytochrome c [Planctomycetes bacterium]|nr:cytochrome c [Planctomycetota bacterium]
MTRPVRFTVCLSALLVIVVVGCAPTGNPGNEEMQRAELEQAGMRIYAALPEDSAKAALIEQGQKMYRTAGCESCHSTRQDRLGLQGPPLGGVSKRVMARQDDDALEARRWLVKHIKSPRLYPSPYKDDEAYHGTFMTPYNQFRDEDMRALVEFLWSLR